MTNAALEKLTAAAEKVAAQRFVVDCLGMTNTPTDIEERVKLDARCMIESDKLYLLQAEYNARLADYVKAERETKP